MTVRELLAERGIDDRHVLALDDRPTTLKERYVGRAEGRHSQQMIRVDRDSRNQAPPDALAVWSRRLAAEVATAAIELVADYGKGICTPELLRSLIGECRREAVRLIVDPIRSDDFTKYRGAHAMTPNRPEAEAATDRIIRTPDKSLAAGQILVGRLGLEAAFVTLDRDGMDLVRADGRAELLPTRPRDVYDNTGAGDMILAAVGLCLADGADYDEAAALGNVAGGFEVEGVGGVPVTRRELLHDLMEHATGSPDKRPGREASLAEVRPRRAPGQTIVWTNGCFDALHVGHVLLLREAAARGDYLIVGVNSDASVRRPKGPARPLNGEADRVEVLAALGCVDAVFVFDDDTPLFWIEAVVLDALVKGGDYRPEEVVVRDVVERAGAYVLLVPIVECRSTTGIIRRAREGSHPCPGGIR